MSSFYGIGGGGSNASGGGVTDYNDLTNKPLISLKGSEEGPVIFGSLTAGEYLVKGTYKYGVNDDYSFETEFLHIEVTVDEETGQKTVTFEKFINGQWNKYVLVFDETGEHQLYTYTFNKDTSTDKGILYMPFDEMEQEAGIEETLYVTEDAIYKYVTDSGFIKLSGNSIWEDMK